MTSQFDSLLDFGDSTPAENGTNQEIDNFDPFGPSPTIDVKGNASSDLLGDFNFDTQISAEQNNSNGKLNSASNLNPLYELSLSSTDKMEEVESVSPTQDCKTTDSIESQKQEIQMTSSSGSTNPLYDFMSAEETNGHSDDLLGTGTSDDSGVTMEPTSTEENLLVSVDSKENTYENEEIKGNGIEENAGPELDEVNENGIQDDQDLVSIEQESSDDNAIENIEKSAEEEEEESLRPSEVLLESSDDRAIENIEKTAEQEESLHQSASNNEDVLVYTEESQQETSSHNVYEEDLPVQVNIMTEEQILQQESAGLLIDPLDQSDEVYKQEAEKEVEIPEPEPESTLVDTEIPEPEPEPSLVDTEITQPEPTLVDTETTQDYSEQHEVVSEEQNVPEVEIVPVEQLVTEDQPEEEEENEDKKVTDEEIIQNEQTDDGQLQDEIATTMESSIITEDEVVQEEEKKPAVQKVEKTEETKPKKEEAASSPVTTTKTTSQPVVQNGDITNENTEKEEIRFDEMSSIKTKFESGDSSAAATVRPSVQDEIMSVEGGVYENEPVHDPDVARESDRHIAEELPEIGTAKNILEKFKQIQTEKSVPVTSASRKREVTPPESRGKGEYVSEPRAVFQPPEQKIEGGIYENQPQEEEGVVKSYETIEDVRPEQGYAKNVLAKFKEIESQTARQPASSPKRELTPDRFTKGEYVSEPRAVLEKYENKVESGIFESQPAEAEDIVKSGQQTEEVMPERGTAKNLASKFKQYETESKSPPKPHQKKELTPDRFTKGEYVSEPRSTLEQYEGQPEAGIFESKPSDRDNIVRSGEIVEESLPEQGYTKNVLSKFKEIQSGSPTATTPRKVKEVTPPREDMFAGVLENKPTESPDVVKSYDRGDVMAELPESGMARNLVSKFREIQTGGQSPTSPRQKKEFTPPPQSGVYENTPQQSLILEERRPESGILESNPTRRDDIAREQDQSVGDVEFPETGYAKNMVSKWRQIESESAKSSTPSPRYKEFTPPRVEPNIASARSPLSPKSPAGVNSSVHPHDLPGQYQEQVQPGIYENQPENRDDLAKEENTDWSEGLPKEGTSKSLISKFKNVQEQAKKAKETPKPVSRKDSTDGSKSPAPNTKKQMFEVNSDVNDAVSDEVKPSSNGTTMEDEQDVAESNEDPKSAFVAIQLEKCAACQKTVYAMEKVEMNKNSYHKACFKCSHCNTRLTAKTFSMNEGIMFCTNHFKQLFARKGNYDEGFGRQQYKKKWQGDTPSSDQQNVEPSA